MKRIILLMVAFFVVILIVKFPHQMISPGPLQEAHADLDTKCNSCHRPFWGIPDANCIACHTPDKIGLDSTDTSKVLFHAHLISQSCISCHDDHKGRIPLTAINSFDHKMLGNITQIACSQCHNAPEDKLHTVVSTKCNSCHQTDSWSSVTSFNHDMITKTDAANCGQCHASPKDQLHVTVTTTSCKSCHSTNAWSPATFEHSKYFVLDNDHNASCNTCHTGQNFSTYTCYGCHEHSERKMISEHAEEGINNIADCARCHKSADEDDAKHSIGDFNGEQRRKHKGDSGEGDDDDD